MTNATFYDYDYDTNQTSLSYDFVPNNTDILQSNSPSAFATTDRDDSTIDSDIVMTFYFVAVAIIVALLGGYKRRPMPSSSNGDGSVPQSNHSTRGRINSNAPTLIGHPLRTTTILNAKKKKPKTKKKAPSSGGGGFGSTATKSDKPSTSKADDKSLSDDYQAFPPLDPNVMESLIPLPVEESYEVTGVYEPLSEDIYGRLGHIYGFRDFNHPPALPNDGHDGAGSDGMADLLGPPPTENLDLASLLTGTNPSPSSSPTCIPALGALPSYDKIRILHVDPLLLAVDEFFTPEECDRYIDLVNSDKKSGTESKAVQINSATVGKDAYSKSQRTSSTWFHHFRDVPELVSKASRLLGLDTIHKWEEPQTVRYRKSEKFTWRLDALSPSPETQGPGGQRVATFLVYLNDLTKDDGGATMFRDLVGPDGLKPLKVRPTKGSALLFFPAAGGIQPNTPFDIRTVHAGEIMNDTPTSGTKWIAQLWLRNNMGYRPTAPPHNSHEDAYDAIQRFCDGSS